MGQEAPPLNIYDKLRQSSGTGGIRQKKDRYKPFIKRLEEDFKDRFDLLAEGSAVQTGPFNFSNWRTAGGVYISNSKPIARFIPTA